VNIVNIVRGDYVRFRRTLFAGGSRRPGGRFRGGHPRGEEIIEGVVERESYGEQTGQHTFSVRTPDGKIRRVMGRNLYPNLLDYRSAADHDDQAKAKAARIKLAADASTDLGGVPARLRRGP